MRWSDRLIGLISMMILARLLTPADFGIIAMATVVVGLVDVLLDLGVNIALIHNHTAEHEDYDTAWTLRLIQAGIVALSIFVFSPLAADYYHNPLVTDVLRVMSLNVVIGGLENIGIVTFQKNMEFGIDFKFFFYKRVTGFLVTLVGAFVLHTYWAMVFGALAGRVMGVFLSYGMHKHRPRFCLTRLSHIWSFSQWVLVRNIGSYLDSRTDKLLVGGRTSAGMTGEYAIADEIAAMPTSELLAPLGRVLFPAFVLKRGDPEAFARSISTAIGVQALVAIPACAGLATVAHDAVWVLLGQKWLASIPLIQVLAMVNLIVALIHSTGYALLAIGQVRMLAAVSWLQAGLFLFTAIILLPHAGANELALIRLAAVTVGSMTSIGIVLTQIKALSMRAFFGPLIRPLIAAGLMALLLHELQPMMSSVVPWGRLLIEVCAGGIMYTICILLMWVVTGKREGGEAYLIKNVLAQRKLLGRLV